jgi:hypothetical protein
MTISPVAGSPTESDIHSLVARLTFSFEGVGLSQQTVRLTDSAAVARFALNLTRAAVVEGPILLDATAAARFGEIVAQGRTELPEPPLDLDAFN